MNNKFRTLSDIEGRFIRKTFGLEVRHAKDYRKLINCAEGHLLVGPSGMFYLLNNTASGSYCRELIDKTSYDYSWAMGGAGKPIRDIEILD